MDTKFSKYPITVFRRQFPLEEKSQNEAVYET